jgi:anti-sigma B factor antagonist
VTDEALNAGEVATLTGSYSVELIDERIAAIELKGEWDLALEAVLRQEINGGLSDDRDVIVDLSEATFIDASIIGALIEGHGNAETRGASLVLQLGTAEIVDRVLQLTRIEDVIPRSGTRARAVQMLSEQRTG